MKFEHMSYDFSSCKEQLKAAEEHLQGALSTLRAGLATPALLDAVNAESYGSRTPIKHLASITIEDPRTLRVTPWDKGLVKDIETSIAAANLGVSTASDSNGLRVVFPELTSERRTTLVKLAKEKFEEARVQIRMVRDEIWTDIQAKEKEGGMSEDEKFRLKDELQKLIDDANGRFDMLLKKKENEIEA